MNDLYAELIEVTKELQQKANNAMSGCGSCGSSGEVIERTAMYAAYMEAIRMIDHALFHYSYEKLKEAGIV